MALEQDLAAIAERCEQLILVHEYDTIADSCARCGQPWACWPRLAAEEMLDGLRRLPLLDPFLPSDQETIVEDSEGWRTSSFSGESGNCVQAKSAGKVFAVRDSKSPDGPILIFGAAEWHAFTQGVRAGEFDE